MNGLLIRVGIDSSKESGKWNAPCRVDGRFCYVPIHEHFENRPSRGPRFEKFYKEFKSYVDALEPRVWPAHLKDNMPCHLDPDFRHLTYGDQGSRRGKRIREILAPGDFIVFWAGLKSVKDERIICSIIGFYVVSYIVNATDIGRLDWHRNAHTRRKLNRNCDDIVVFAKPESSGRLRKYIKIGEYRERAQRVDKKLLKKWGPLCKKDRTKIKNGYIHMSAALPIFGKPKRFLKWFKDQKPKLIHANNI
jgi:hypothetical protein